jgi:hypothetical protein
MTTQLEIDLSKLSALHQHQQGEARRMIRLFQLEVEERSLNLFKQMVNLALTDQQQKELDLVFDRELESNAWKGSGTHGGRPYSFGLREFHNGEIGWTVVFFDENDDEIKAVIAFEHLYHELLKVMMRYDILLDGLKNTFTDDDVDSDTGLIAEKEE